MKNTKINIVKTCLVNCIILVFFAQYSFGQAKSKQTNKQTIANRPNVIIILADDMGFSDLGCMGSLIQTPALDNLAKGGIAFSNFYNTGRCCPSRASLMCGKYAHKVGMGWMSAANLKQSGYIGDLDTNSPTIAQVLGNSGYACYMSGKWHLTADKFVNDTASKHNWPLQRGFDKYFGILGGGDSYYTPKDLVSGNSFIDAPNNFYLTDAISDSAIKFIDQHNKYNNIKKSTKPFFCYLAYTSPHRPLHAKKSDIAKYKSVFDQGWDSLRIQKARQLSRTGWTNKNMPLSDKDNRIMDWNAISLEEKLGWQAKMETYAAQIDNMDQGIDRLIEMLAKNKQLDNTIIFFMSDNGGNQEKEAGEMPMKTEDIEPLGQEKPRFSYNREWAQVSNSPFRSYKSYMYEGGIASPLLVYWPKKIRTKGIILDQTAHLIDIMPTILDLSKPPNPKKPLKKPIQTDGISLKAALEGKKIIRSAIYFEHETSCGLREGKWKLVSNKSDKAPYSPKWELYNLQTDRGETKNLASKYTKLVGQLSDKWYKWAASANVLPLDGRGWYEKIGK